MASPEEIQALAHAYVEDWHRDLPRQMTSIPLFGHNFQVGEIFRDGLTLKYIGPSNKTLRRNDHGRSR